MDIPVVTPATSDPLVAQLPKIPFFKNKRVIGIIVVLVLVVILAGFLLLRGTVGDRYGLKVFEGSYTSGRVLEFGLFGLQEERVKTEGELSDYAEHRGVKVAIVRNPEANTQDIFLLGPKSKQLTTNGIGKASISVSPDGKSIAYAQRADHVVGGEFSSYISGWLVTVQNIETGEVVDLGQGFAPQFYTNQDGATRVLFTTRTGVSSVDLKTKSVRSIDFINPGIIDFAATISGDGKYLAVPNGITKVSQIFSVTETETEFSVALATIGTVPFTHAAFVGHKLYGVSRTDDGSASLYVVSGDTKDVPPAPFALPKNSSYRIIP